MINILKIVFLGVAGFALLVYLTAPKEFLEPKNKNIELPITNEIYQVLFNNKDCKDSVNDLMMRDIKSEF